MSLGSGVTDTYSMVVGLSC